MELKETQIIKLYTFFFNDERVRISSVNGKINQINIDLKKYDHNLSFNSKEQLDSFVDSLIRINTSNIFNIN